MMWHGLVDNCCSELMTHYNIGSGPHAGQQGWEHAAVTPGTGPWAYPFVHVGVAGDPVSPHPGDHGDHPEVSMIAWTKIGIGLVALVAGGLTAFFALRRRDGGSGSPPDDSAGKPHDRSVEFGPGEYMTIPVDRSVSI